MSYKSIEGVTGVLSFDTPGRSQSVKEFTRHRKVKK